MPFLSIFYRLLREAEHFVQIQQETQKRGNWNNLQSVKMTMPEIIPHSSDKISETECEVNQSNNAEHQMNSSQPISDSLRKSKIMNSKRINNIPTVEFVEDTPVSGTNENSTNSILHSKAIPIQKSEQNSNNIRGNGTMSKHGVKIREDKNVIVDITPRNIGRRVVDKNEQCSNNARSFHSPYCSNSHSNCSCNIRLEDLSLSNREESDIAQLRKSNKMSRKLPKDDLVSMVTVEYGDNRDQELAGKNKALRLKKPMSEVETLVSQLSNLEHGTTGFVPDIKSETTLISDLLHKSQPEKNYYEVSRTRKQGATTQPATRSMQKESINVDDKSSSHNSSSPAPIYKTTKTMEFDLQNVTLTEMSKSEIHGQIAAKIKKEAIFPPSFYSKQVFNFSFFFSFFFLHFFFFLFFFA